MIVSLNYLVLKDVRMLTWKIHKCELVVYYSNYAMLYFIILNYMSIIDANNSKCKKIH